MSGGESLREVGESDIGPLSHALRPNAAGSVSVVTCRVSGIRSLSCVGRGLAGGVSILSLVSCSRFCRLCRFFRGFLSCNLHSFGFPPDGRFLAWFQLTPLLLPNNVRVDGRRTLHRLLVVRQPSPVRSPTTSFTTPPAPHSAACRRRLLRASAPLTTTVLRQLSQQREEGGGEVPASTDDLPLPVRRLRPPLRRARLVMAWKNPAWIGLLMLQKKKNNKNLFLLLFLMTKILNSRCLTRKLTYSCLL